MSDKEIIRFVGKRIAKARHRCKLTQDGLVAKIPVSRSTLQRWEVGRVSTPAHHLINISTILGVALSYFDPIRR